MGKSTENIRKNLLARRAELLEQAAASQSAAQTVELDQTRVGRLSRMDALQGQAMAKATEQRRQAALAAVDAALARLENGDYGYCVKCDEEIEPKRLEYDPATALCLACAR